MPDNVDSLHYFIGAIGDVALLVVCFWRVLLLSLLEDRKLVCLKQGRLTLSTLMAAMDPIDISSDSDDWFEDDDFDTSPIRRSTESRVLPSWATTAGTDSRRQTPHTSPRREHGSNGSSSSVNDHSFLKSSHRLTTQADDSLYFAGNGNMGQPRTVNSRIANVSGTDYEKLSSQQALKRTLPASFHRSPTNSKPTNLVESGSSSQTRDIYGSMYHLAGPSLTNCKGYMRDHYGRGNYEDVVMYENNGSRTLPPSLMHGKSISSGQFGSSDPAYRPMVGEESVTGNDERLIYQAALEDLNQPKTEATPPDGLLSVPLLRHQKIALAWMLQKETRSLHCLGGILADDQGLGKTVSMIALIQMQKSLESKSKSEDQSNHKPEALNLDDDDENSRPGLVEVKQTGESDDIKSIPEVSTSTRPFKRKRPAAGTLVVCPASILRQWARELDDKVADEAKLTFLVYHGGSRTKDPVELAKFLRYDPYAVYKSFYSTIKVPISRNSLHGYKKLQAVLRAIMLRRTKGTLIDGEPIIKLPPKSIYLKKVDFSAEERAFYTRLEADSRSKFKAYAAAGTVNQNYANILLMLLRLRQACDHPLLVKGFNSDLFGKVSTEMARRLPNDMVIDLLKCLATSSAICRACNDPPEDPVVTMCGHVFCYQCLSDYLTGDENTCPAPGCKEQLGSDVVFSEATLKSCLSDNHDAGAKHPEFDEKSMVLQHEYFSSKIRAVLEILQSHCQVKSPSPELNRSTGCNGTSTAYLSSSTEGPMKSIVFSQWTSMLDLVEMSLNQYCIQYRRLDGTMTLTARDRAAKDFSTDPEVTVMLMSLKAGNLGLNMVAACHVILLDLWWNPTTEDQAVDRAHRIGQTRPVTVTRLTIKDTVEDRILALQEEKRKMVASAFGEDPSGGSATRLTVEDLKYLFMGRSAPGV
ncbi:hypothetical protein GH714_017085 [Hevea brasiliensis]|uniref:Helicase-like transcription factor CHR28 n=1 Tax=Hevea brasiliensis TaxID=3981 RepID=A0A6A6NCP0_HEVBR|nr:hypothetical protein GH714_017085 [Hevea brasiliensis]